jgi:hypothetical protein
MFNESEIPDRSNGPLLSPIGIVNLSDTRTALSSCWGKERESPNGCHQSVSLCSLWKPHYLAPCHERLLTEHAIMGGSHQMSSTAKQIVDRTMSREKTLGLSGGLERGVLDKRLLQRVERSARRRGSAVRTAWGRVPTGRNLLILLHTLASFRRS